jgi:hypothetical protein
VGGIATAKEGDWEHEMPALKSAIATVVVSLDGAVIPMADSAGYREAIVGSLSFERDRKSALMVQTPREEHDGPVRPRIRLSSSPVGRRSRGTRA